MNAIHIIWTKPALQNNTIYQAEDFELLSTILSALKWREKNGDITLVTDSAGAAYYHSLGLSPLWNTMDIILDEIDPSIDPQTFWAGGKLFALSRQTTPCVMMDTDFIVWEQINFDAVSAPLAVIHREALYPDVYPDTPEFRRFDQEFNWEALPANTAFAYINDQTFLSFYTKTALDVMKRTEKTKDRLKPMVFAEQRLFSMCADKLNLELYSFSGLDRLFRDGENYFTHLWGFKEQMRQNYLLRYDFCKKCVNRIRKDFPEWADALKRIDLLKPYL